MAYNVCLLSLRMIFKAQLFTPILFIHVVTFFWWWIKLPTLPYIWHSNVLERNWNNITESQTLSEHIAAFGLSPSPLSFGYLKGPVHAYVAIPGGKTCYLSELKAGKEVIVVDQSRIQRTAIVGRVKIETRPLLLVEAQVCAYFSSVTKGNNLSRISFNVKFLDLLNFFVVVC